MTVRPALLLVLVLVIGFLTSSTIYFYLKSRSGGSQKTDGATTFSADLPLISASQATTRINELTRPAEPKGRLSYPANVYDVGERETLLGIGTKFGLDWKIIKLANGTANENLIQAGDTLVIPALEPTTDLYRVNFKINEDMASILNRELREQTTDPRFDPVSVARTDAVPFFGLTSRDEFTLLERNENQGTALVEAKNGSVSVAIGLFQPKVKGERGFWAVLYVELRV